MYIDTVYNENEKLQNKSTLNDYLVYTKRYDILYKLGRAREEGFESIIPELSPNTGYYELTEYIDALDNYLNKLYKSRRIDENTYKLLKTLLNIDKISIKIAYHRKLYYKPQNVILLNLY